MFRLQSLSQCNSVAQCGGELLGGALDVQHLIGAESNRLLRQLDRGEDDLGIQSRGLRLADRASFPCDEPLKIDSIALGPLVQVNAARDLCSPVFDLADRLFRGARNGRRLNLI